MMLAQININFQFDYENRLKFNEICCICADHEKINPGSFIILI